MKPITTFLFDVGGVLSLGTAAEVRRRLARKLRIEPESMTAVWRDSHLEMATGRKTPESFAAKLARQMGIDGRRVLDAWRDVATTTFVPREELVSLAHDLRLHYRVGVLSNTNSLHADVNRKSGIYEGFEPVLLSCEIGYAKPDAAAYRHALATLGEEPESCLLVDDRSENVESARRLDMHAIEYRSTQELRRQLERLRVRLAPAVDGE